MKIAVLGTGDVGRVLGSGLIRAGHEVILGSRTRDKTEAVDWARENGDRASNATFEEAAREAELVFNCTAGVHALSALEQAGAANLAGKVLVDVSNPLDFSNGFPPTLLVCNMDSLGEQIQRAFPKAKVVKAFNTLANPLMVDPNQLPGDHQLLVCGDDTAAKEQVRELAGSFGWRESQWLDLGGIEQARGTEMYLALWVRLYGRLQTPLFNLSIVTA